MCEVLLASGVMLVPIDAAAADTELAPPWTEVSMVTRTSADPATENPDA